MILWTSAIKDQETETAWPGADLRAWLSKSWRFGFFHNYHDGPHHSLWLGCINIGWMRDAVCPVCEDAADYDGSIAGWVERILTAAMGREVAA